jgi:hypothetical protein
MTGTGRATILAVDKSCLPALLMAISLAGCGSSGAPQPSALPPTVAGIAPDNGSTAGGTAVTITGTHFSSGMAVSLGGSPATNVVVASDSMASALTGPHATGTVDVTVAVGSQAGTLAGAFTYKTPPPNSPPVISAIVAQGARLNEPPQFADLGEAVTVTATVTDVETAISALDFAWSATTGTLSGTGNVVTWTAPAAFDAPGAVTITLTVTERYIGADQNGQPVPAENTVSAASVVSLHDSVREVSGMARQFLLDFSDSSLSPEYVVRNFTTSCAGRQAELNDVADDRARYIITSSQTGSPVTTVAFGGICPDRNVAGDACAQVPVKWTSKSLTTSATRTDTGTDQVAAVYEAPQWRLCDSKYKGTCTGTACGEGIRAFMR